METIVAHLPRGAISSLKEIGNISILISRIHFIEFKRGQKEVERESMNNMLEFIKGREKQIYTNI